MQTAKPWYISWIDPHFLDRFTRNEMTGKKRNSGKTVVKRWSHDVLEKWSGPIATLTISKKDFSNQETELNCELITTMREKETTQKQTGRIICRNDNFFTPVKWQQKCACFDKNGKELKYSRLKEHAEFSGIKISSTVRGKTETEIRGNFTSNQAFYLAVSNLCRNMNKPLQYTLLEDFVSISPGRILRRADSQKLDIAGRQVTFHCFLETGPGIEPSHYWFDKNYNLVFVVRSICFLDYVYAD